MLQHRPENIPSWFQIKSSAKRLLRVIARWGSISELARVSRRRYGGSSNGRSAWFLWTLPLLEQKQKQKHKNNKILQRPSIVSSFTWGDPFKSVHDCKKNNFLSPMPSTVIRWYNTRAVAGRVLSISFLLNRAVSISFEQYLIFQVPVIA